MHTFVLIVLGLFALACNQAGTAAFFIAVMLILMENWR